MAECLTPFAPDKNKPSKVVACGKCPRCKSRVVSGWSFRLMQQYKIAETADWITLTYAPEHMNHIITDNGFMTLCKRDVQLFLKNLRYAQFGSNESNIKYFAVGEYGGRFNRPHYHITLFNARRELIQNAWKKGNVFYGDVNEASVGYTLKYMMKDGKIPMHQRDDRVKEFRLMSKGLGKNYLTPAMIAWHKANLTERMYCNLSGGKKISMPRYYKDKIYNEIERKEIANAFELKAIDNFYKTLEREGIDHRKFLDKKAKIEFELNRNHKNALKGREHLI